MRKNTARHWLHAGLDLLPLILIPVFMIYSHRHTIDSGSIDVPFNKVVDFNQKTIYIDGTHKYFNLDVDVSVSAETIHVYGTSNYVSGDPNYYAALGSQNVTSGHKYYISCTSDIFYVYVYAGLITSGTTEYISTASNNSMADFTIRPIDNTYIENGTVLDDSFSCMFIDLTQMFGVGNEPTIQQFKTWYPNDYYKVVGSRKELIKGYSTQTYDDTDIMSQFTYQLYNSVDKYFNMGNVFNLGGVYDWFNLNIFGGNAPISIFIVWNIVLYEFVMDLLFLLYALFMWFIDVTKRLIEKPLDSIK